MGYEHRRFVFFSITEKGSKILIEEFPNKQDVDDTKKQIEKI